jgi:hypothetical protein
VPPLSSAVTVPSPSLAVPDVAGSLATRAPPAVDVVPPVAGV